VNIFIQLSSKSAKTSYHSSVKEEKTHQLLKTKVS